MPSQVCPAALLKLIGRYRWRERGFKGWLRETGQRVGPAFLFLPHRPLENGRILLANSPEQNCRGKICSHRGAKLDENRTSALTSSTIMQSMACDCRLAVISPVVSDRKWSIVRFCFRGIVLRSLPSSLSGLSRIIESTSY